MEYDVKFPDMANYDIKKPGEMALYHAHCDFMPFRSVIETTQVSLSAMREYYHEHTEKAREVGDYVTEEWAMTSGMLYTARAIPLSYYSLVLVMVSLLEEAFNTLCRAYCIINKYQIVQKDMAGQGLERAVNYLEKVASVRGIKSDTQWEYVKTIRDARNMVVHNGGRVTGKKDAYKKFGFYLHEEDSRLDFEHDDIVRMYEAIMEFIDRVFRMEPSNEMIGAISE
ncbi:hypothetical protein MFMK1_001734 [Metallumcola ferriviriculae]|uniref:DUF4145 domain-containing protein n=1 Tax=Metallumcola ferriviriculae TaxID=3039180 RepID=A0AAU0URS0_9FIRM|nr:hypothetical protein MFMK1_001734 [Desulfitibacteraceae bacterium MK1]